MNYYCNYCTRCGALLGSHPDHVCHEDDIERRHGRLPIGIHGAGIALDAARERTAERTEATTMLNSRLREVGLSLRETGDRFLELADDIDCGKGIPEDGDTAYSTQVGALVHDLIATLADPSIGSLIRSAANCDVYRAKGE